MNEGFGELSQREAPPRLPTPEILEREISQNIEVLPPELAPSWEKRLEAAEDEELPALARELQEVLSRRRIALAPSAPQFFRPESVHLVEDAERIAETVSRIAALEGRAELFVGSGKRGHVFADPDAPGICYKFILNPENYEEYNSVTKEAEFLEILENFEVGGVRTPKLHARIDRPDIKVITMERIDGENIEVTIEKKRELPPNFDLDSFFEKLGTYIETMHRQLNIYHRDLHAGNILIGRDGNPYIIDLGKSMLTPNEEWAYEITGRTGEHRSFLISDESHLKSVKSRLRQYIRERAQVRQEALT